MPLKAEAKEFNKLSNVNRYCPVCKGEIYSYDSNVEYVKTKRSSHVFIHTECVPKWGE